MNRTHDSDPDSEASPSRSGSNDPYAEPQDHDRHPTKGAGESRVRANPGAGSEDDTRTHPLLEIQRRHGNRAVQKLVRDGTVRTKLTVGSATDEYEREANRVAEMVVHEPDTAIEWTNEGGRERSPDVRRMCSRCRNRVRQGKPLNCSSCEPGVQFTESAPAGPPPSDGLHRALRSSTSAGRPLPSSVRSTFEARFGHDLGNVRMHDDANAAALSDHLGARAFTYGSDVFFNTGEYRPHTPEGQELLAHELTHTLQQSRIGPRVQRFGVPGWVSTVGRGLKWAGGKVVGGAKWAGGKVVEGAKWAGGKVVGGAEWVGGKVAEGLEWAGEKAMAVWECVRRTGHSASKLVSGDFRSLAELIGVPEPTRGSPQALDTIGAVLHHPCLRMLPGYSTLLEISELEEVRSFLGGVWRIMQDPGIVIDAIREAISEMIAEVPGHARNAIRGVVAGSEGMREHLEGIWEHLSAKVEYMVANWWEVLKESAWDLIWPWEGAWDDVTKIWGSVKSAASNLWDLRLSAAVDDLLSVWRTANALAGRFYGWFFIASVLIGGIIGAFFGGAGAIPGAVAGAAIATKVGYGLLISAIAAETMQLGKGVFDLARAVSGEDLAEAYGTIADSGLALGIMGVFAALGAVAARFARGLVARLPKLGVKVRKILKPGLREAAWRRYKDKTPESKQLTREQWEKRVDILEQNKETGKFFEKILQGEEGGDRQVRFDVEESLDPRRALVEEVHGVGEKFGKRLRDGGIETVGDLLGLSPDELANLLRTGNKRASNILEMARKLEANVTHRRHVDLVSEASIFEVKTGNPDLTSFIRRQIRVDALLRDVLNYQPVWVFYGKPSPALLQALRQAGIRIEFRKIPIDFVGVGAAGQRLPEELGERNPRDTSVTNPLQDVP